MLRNCLSKVRWIALASVVAIGAAGSAWATPAVYDLSFSCAGLGCGTASPSLALTVNGSSVSFTGSIFGQTLTTGSFLVTPTSPTLVTGTAGTATGSALTLGGSTGFTFGSLSSLGSGGGTWFATGRGGIASGTFKIVAPAIPEPGAVLLFAVGLFVVGRRVRATA
jgi:hypothetical protein